LVIGVGFWAERSEALALGGLEKKEVLAGRSVKGARELL